MGSQENHEETHVKPSQSRVSTQEQMQNLVEWERATRGDNGESEGKRFEKNSSSGRSRSASYDSAGSIGGAQGWSSRATWNHAMQTSRQGYEAAGAASGPAQSGPMRRGYLHVERADRAFAGYGAPYGRASAGWKSRGLRSGISTGQQFSGRSGCSQRISRGGSTWVVVAGLGEWSAPGK